jgi:hypothetical protein
LRLAGGQPAQNLFTSLIGEEEFPADPITAVQHGWRRRRNLQAIAISLDERAASDVTLNQPLGFQFRIGVRHGRAVDSQHRCQFPTGWNPVTLPQVTCVNERSELIAELHIERNVAFRLKV